VPTNSWSKRGGLFERHSGFLGVLRFVLNGDSLLRVAESWSWIGASELLFLDGVVLIPVGTSIIRRVALPFPVLLKTVDAVHLATLEQASDGEDPENWAFLTTDQALSRAARLLRYQVV